MGEQWIIDLESKLRNIKVDAEIKSQKKYYFQSVPGHLAKDYTGVFDPVMVTFGPYFYKPEEDINRMDIFKYRAMINYLGRAEKTLVEVAEAMRKIVKEAMESYKELDVIWTEESFNENLQMLLLDGCFLLDLLIWHSVQYRPLSLMRIWQTDALKVENQLPISVLAKLIEVGGHKDEDTIKFFESCYPSRSRPEMVKDISEMGHHYLDIYRKNLTLEGEYFYDFTCSVHPASVLIDSGVQFMKSESKSFKDISFENGVLKLPSIDVNIHTHAVLMNMVAYEQMFEGKDAVSSYILLMGDIINSARDVSLLRENGIIRGMVGSDREITSIFILPRNQIIPELGDEKHYTDQTDDGRGRVNVNVVLNDYYNKRLNRWHASFMQSYLKNPWVFFSLLGALVLLVLTVLQTLYTIIPYYKGQ